MSVNKSEIKEQEKVTEREIPVPIYAGLPIAPAAEVVAPYPPEGYLRLSQAYSSYHAGVWGGFKPCPLAQALRSTHGLSVESGGRRIYAAQPLTAAVSHGNVKAYVVADPRVGPSIDRPKWLVAWTKEPVLVPPSVLRRLIAPRDMLPDRVIHPTLKAAGGDQKLYVLLMLGVLVVQEREFKDWCRSQRSRGKWPSQRSRSKKPSGRITKQTEPLRSEVLMLARDRASAKDKSQAYDAGARRSDRCNQAN